MSSRFAASCYFLVVNLVAVYVPALFWLSGLPGSLSIAEKFLLSPVLFALLVVWTKNPVVAWGILVGFLLLVWLLSAVFCKSKPAWVWLPCALFVVSLLQGLVASDIARGINAIGGS